MSERDIPTAPVRPARRFVLPVLCLAQFMVILDVSIVNIALPSIQRDLDVSQEHLQWVVTAYGLTLGGFLLLGGRCADLLGRRRIFMTGITLFTLASLACGLAPSIGVLVVARALQGLGSALTAPAALSLLTTVYSEGADRNKALGIWGALGGSGAAVGVLLGGVITEGLGWEWIFFINIPIGLLVVLAAPRVLPEGAGETGRRHFDAGGAVAVTAGLLLGVYAVHRSVDHGWTTPLTLTCAMVSLALLALFLLIETRSRHPLMPLSIFRLRSVAAANGLALLVFGALFSLFFMLSLYMQQVLGYSALRAGLAYFPLAFLIVVSATIASQVVTRVGPKMVLTAGMVMVGSALLLFARAPVDGHYLTDLLPGFILAAVGLGASVVPIQVAAFIGVRESESGLAAGLINTAQEVGGALVIAALATISFSQTREFLAERGGDPQLLAAGLTHGFHFAFTVAAILAFSAALICVLALPGRTGAPPELEPKPGVPPTTPEQVTEGETGVATA